LASVVPWVIERAIDDLRRARPLHEIWWLAAAMIGVSLAGGAMRFGMRMTLNSVSRRMEYDLRNDLFRHLTRLDPTYYGGMRTGDLMARLTNDLSAVRMAVGPAIMYLASTIAGGAFALGYMIAINARLTAIALLPMTCLPIVAIALGRRIHDRFQAVQEHFSTMTTMAQENLAGVRVVRAFRQEGAEVDRFAAMNDEYLSRNMRLAHLYGIMQPSFGAFVGLAMVAVLGGGGALVVNGIISIGAFVAFGIYLGMLAWPMIALGYVINLFQRGIASTTRLLEIMDAESQVAASPARAHLAPAAGRTIEFRNVGFHYPAPEGSAPRWVLRHVSFTAPAGSTIGIVGATGSGKSALMDLIPRLYDPQEGTILIDGVPTRDLDPAALRRDIGYVPQESFLFSDTIRANLAYGTPDDAAVIEAAHTAQLTETVAAFPGGLDTVLGERGINLSGGQKQRSALARALARRPPIVLLDDALSAVDAHTEAEILTGLRNALAGRTALIASHRISAIREATWIIVLDQGEIVEQGRHTDLMAAKGQYWTLLYRQQLEESIERDEADLALTES